RKQPDLYLPVFFEIVSEEQSLIDHPEILELYCDQFEYPPSSDFSLDKVAAAIAALSGFRLALEWMRSGRLLRLLGSIWARIWLWIDAIHHKLVLPAGFKEDDDIKCGVALTTQCIILALLEESPAASTVMATKGVLRVAFETYVAIGKGPPLDNNDIVPLCKSTCTTLQNLIGCPLADFNEVIEVLHAKKHGGPRALFQAMYMACNGGYEWERAFPILLNVHLHLSTEYPNYYQSLPVKMVMFYLCDALSHFTLNHLTVADCTINTRTDQIEQTFCVEVILFVL
ncbi:hypothetical protein DXG01_006713, partial [Tephrocybe rancida]